MQPQHSWYITASAEVALCSFDAIVENARIRVPGAKTQRGIAGKGGRFAGKRNGSAC
jgi:hypothetical protein